jgi:hypothetical protein
MIALVAAFRAVTEHLERLDIEYVVVGSTAAASWGVVRATRDVDLVAVISADQGEMLLGSFGSDLYVPIDQAREALSEHRSFNVLHPASGGKVDVFVAPPSDTFTRSRLGRRIATDVLGVPSWVATAEDVILAKLRWRLDSRSEVQWRDCVEIAAVVELDTEYMWAWAAPLAVEADLKELLAISPLGNGS